MPRVGRAEFRRTRQNVFRRDFRPTCGFRGGKFRERLAFGSVAERHDRTYRDAGAEKAAHFARGFLDVVGRWYRSIRPRSSRLLSEIAVRIGQIFGGHNTSCAFDRTGSPAFGMH